LSPNTSVVVLSGSVTGASCRKKTPEGVLHATEWIPFEPTAIATVDSPSYWPFLFAISSAVPLPPPVAFGVTFLRVQTEFCWNASTTDGGCGVFAMRGGGIAPFGRTGCSRRYATDGSPAASTAIEGDRPTS